MYKHFIPFVLVVCVVALTPTAALAQADIIKDEIYWYYFPDDLEGNLQYLAAGGSDEEVLRAVLDGVYSCTYDVGAFYTPSRYFDVLTPSGVNNISVHGPMYFVVWEQGMSPCDEANWIAAGWGQQSTALHMNYRKGTQVIQFTGVGYLEDWGDSCDGDFVDLNVIWSVSGDLSCDATATCDKYKEKVILECPLLP